VLALSEYCAQCPVWLFSVVPSCPAYQKCWSGIFLNNFEMVPVAPIITGITTVCTFHMPCICIVRYLISKHYYLLLLSSSSSLLKINSDPARM
jgi:hypothetical protein